MTDRRDTDPELTTMLSELEETLTALRGGLEEGETAPVGQSGPDRRRDAGRREGPPLARPPGMREILRFTEQQTIPTLIAILEANIRLLRLAGAALRAVDPERSAVESGGDGAVSRALDAGGRLSTNRLSSGLDELQSALAGTEATNPEARQLLEEAERLSEEVRERIRESEGEQWSDGRRSETEATEPATSESSGPVHIEVEEPPESGGEETADDSELDSGVDVDAESDSGVDVDAELDSIREEVRGETDDSDDADSAGEGDDHDGETGENDGSDGKESTSGESSGEESANDESNDEKSTGEESTDNDSTGHESVDSD